MTEPTITKAHVHYGIPCVEVEPYQIEDRGQQFEVEEFITYSGPSYIEAKCWWFKKTGERAARFSWRYIPVPANVRAALAELESNANR